MGKIVRNSIAYTGSSNIAGNISYDNSQAQLRSTTVQNAITELSNEVINGIRQVTTLPTASLTEVGNIYQYIGETSGSITHGYIYECKSDGENPATYSWVELPTFSTSAEGGVGRTEEDLQGHPLGEYFNLYEDYTDPVSGDITQRNGATGEYSHAEGFGNITAARSSHVEGETNEIEAGSISSHVEGVLNYIGSGCQGSHIEGYDNSIEDGSSYNHIEGNTNLLGAGNQSSHIEGMNNEIISGGSYGLHIDGKGNTVSGAQFASNVSGHSNTVGYSHVSLHVEGSSNTVPSGKTTMNPSTGAITGNDIGGHVEGISNSLVLDPNNANMAVGKGYHIEGESNKITYKDHQNNVVNTSNLLANDSHLEGGGNSICGGSRNHVEGDGNWLSGSATHVEGSGNKVYNAEQSHVEGGYNNVHSAPGTTYTSYDVHVEGYGHNVQGVTNGSHIEGQSNNIYSNNNAFQIHVEGNSNNIGSSTVNVSVSSAHIEGRNGGIDPSVTTVGDVHIEGYNNKITKINDLGNISAYGSHIEGNNNKVNASYSHVEGYQNEDHGDGYYNHVEGYRNVSHGQYSHTEGTDNKMYGTIGHVEGQYNEIGAYDSTSHRVTSYANHSHVEGTYNTALNSMAHIEGYHNTIRSVAGHAEGEYNEILVDAHAAHVGGMNNKADRSCQTAIGHYNKYEASNDDYSSNLLVALQSEISDNTSYLNDSQTDGTTATSFTSGLSGFIPVKASLYKIHAIVPIDSGGTPSYIHIGIYDKNKNMISKIKELDTDLDGAVDYILDIEKINSSGHTLPATEVKYIRFTSDMSTSNLHDTTIQSALLPTLVAIGNGYSRQEGGQTVTVRQNILEISPNFVNINGDIYQNGELFREGTPHFVGTTVEWAALSAQEKAAYTGGDVVFTDDNAGVGVMDNVVTQNSQNPVTSAGIYAALAEITRPDPHISTNGFYYAREYYDGRQVVHYRRHFGTTTFTVNATKEVELGSWAGLPAKFDNVLDAAFNSNNYVINAIVFKDDKTAGQALTIGSLGKDQNDNYVVYITCTGTESYVNGFTVDITIDTF